MSTKKSVEELIAELYAFAEEPKALIVRDFIRRQKLSESRFTTLLKNNPELLEAYNYARLAIGIRRENLALSNKISATIYRDTQPLYDDELKTWEVEKKKGVMTIDDGMKKLEIIYAKAQEQLADS